MLSYKYSMLRRSMNIEHETSPGLTVMPDILLYPITPAFHSVSHVVLHIAITIAIPSIVQFDLAINQCFLFLWPSISFGGWSAQLIRSAFTTNECGKIVECVEMDSQRYWL